jgi:hypothetical protein
MITITGTIRKGYGGASRNLLTQLPLIAEQFPEVKDCFHGTLNVELQKPLLVLSPDHRTKPIDWDSANHPGGEVFGILRIRLEAPPGSSKMAAWLYIAHNSDHRKNLCMHEVIAPKLQVSVGGLCTIHIDRVCLTVPYRQFPITLVL